MEEFQLEINAQHFSNLFKQIILTLRELLTFESKDFLSNQVTDPLELVS